jgi:preprotein translocase subunit Sss1
MVWASGLLSVSSKPDEEELTTIAASTGWTVGLVLGVVVIAVAAVIVIVIVALAMRIAKQADTADGAVEVVREQTAELDGGVGRINDSGVRILHAARALRKVAVGR